MIFIMILFFAVSCSSDSSNTGTQPARVRPSASAAQAGSGSSKKLPQSNQNVQTDPNFGDNDTNFDSFETPDSTEDMNTPNADCSTSVDSRNCLQEKPATKDSGDADNQSNECMFQKISQVSINLTGKIIPKKPLNPNNDRKAEPNLGGLCSEIEFVLGGFSFIIDTNTVNPFTKTYTYTYFPDETTFNDISELTLNKKGVCYKNEEHCKNKVPIPVIGGIMGKNCEYEVSETTSFDIKGMRIVANDITIYEEKDLLAPLDGEHTTWKDELFFEKKSWKEFAAKKICAPFVPHAENQPIEGFQSPSSDSTHPETPTLSATPTPQTPAATAIPTTLSTPASTTPATPQTPSPTPRPRSSVPID